jgi:hypothetical protein
VTDYNGNVASETAIVTVEDNVAPNVITQNITVDLDAVTGLVSITPAMIDNGSTDACGIATMTLDITGFDCGDVGPNTVTLTVTDVNSNSASATAVVTVQDVTPPTALCQNLTLYLDASGNTSTTAAAVDNGSSDNCGIQSLVLSETAFDCGDVGVNTVTLTVTDVNGLISTCTAEITVMDIIPPNGADTESSHSIWMPVVIPALQLLLLMPDLQTTALLTTWNYPKKLLTAVT